MKFLLLLSFTLFGLSCREGKHVDLPAGTEVKNRVVVEQRKIATTKQLEEFLVKGRTTPEIVALLGVPNNAREDTGSGPPLVGPHENVYIWKYYDRLGELVLDAPLVLLVGTKQGSFSKGDYLIRWFYSK
jgi:hypothetical protein